MSDNRLLKESYLRPLLHSENIRPRKSRGQNFLVDKNILAKIIAAAELKPKDLLFEVGPGVGGLTRELCLRGKKVLAVEYDRGLLRLLKKETEDLDNIEILEGDILEMDLGDIFSRLRGGEEKSLPIKIVSNLPYSISGPFLIRLLTSSLDFKRAVVMLQREVGERIVSPPGRKKYGILGCAAQTFSVPEIIGPVSKNCFYPRPRVDSVIVRLDEKEPVMGADEIRFWKKIVRAAFSTRRKMVKNALAGSREFDYSLDLIDEGFRRADIDSRLRAEDITPDGFLRLTRTFLEL